MKSLFERLAEEPPTPTDAGGYTVQAITDLFKEDLRAQGGPPLQLLIAIPDFVSEEDAPAYAERRFKEILDAYERSKNATD